MNKFGFIIPVYKHGSTLESVVKNVISFGYPIIVVDDGNDEENKKFIADVEKKYELVTVVTRKKNGGKGRAFKSGMIKANELGLTHILQIDSDGQHDAGKAEFFFGESEKNPNAVICAYPEYDESVPAHRLNGRKIANAWVHIVTLSNSIVDALIGFRVYPVDPYIRLIKHHALIDTHMGFDIDMLVRYSWKNIPIISYPVKVSYPADGVSTFRMFRDNFHISITYAKLCIGMIIRLPILLCHKIKNKQKQNR